MSGRAASLATAAPTLGVLLTATIRWQMRWLILALIAGAVAWIHTINYIKWGITLASMVRDAPLDLPVFWGGALLLGLALDGLAGLRLRRFFRVHARLAAGESLDPATVRQAAADAVAFPLQAVRWLLGGAVLLDLAFHISDYGSDLIPALTAPARSADRFALVTNVLNEMLLATLLALLLFTFGRRILQRALLAFGLREVPATARLSVSARLLTVILFEAATYTTLYASLPADLPPERMLGLYIPLGVISLVAGYLVAADTGRDLHRIADRLRALAAGLRPDLFDRLAVTGHDEVGELLSSINTLQDRFEAEFRAFECDLQAARSIQTELLPKSWPTPAGWEVAARLLPAQAVGGDFYDVIPLPGGRLGVAVGDAAGKGLPAALLMASTVSLLRSHAPLHAAPGAVLEAVNRLLCGSLPPMTFVTLAYAVIDPVQRQVVLASAGHLPPCIGGREAEPVSSLPLGVDPEARYRTRSCTLRPSEPFLLCSDGLLEATDPTGRLLGAGPVAALTGTPCPGAAALVEAVLETAIRHTAGRSPTDDMVVLALVPPPESAPALAPTGVA